LSRGKVRNDENILSHGDVPSKLAGRDEPEGDVPCLSTRP